MFLELPKLIQDALIGRLDTIHLQDEILGKTNATGWLGLGLCWERLRKKPAVFFPKFGRLPAHAPVIPGRWQQTLAKPDCYPFSFSSQNLLALQRPIAIL